MCFSTVFYSRFEYVNFERDAKWFKKRKYTLPRKEFALIKEYDRYFFDSIFFLKSDIKQGFFPNIEFFCLFEHFLPKSQIQLSNDTHLDLRVCFEKSFQKIVSKCKILLQLYIMIILVKNFLKSKWRQHHNLANEISCMAWIFQKIFY